MAACIDRMIGDASFQKVPEAADAEAARGFGMEIGSGEFAGAALVPAGFHEARAWWEIEGVLARMQGAEIIVASKDGGVLATEMGLTFARVLHDRISGLHEFQPGGDRARHRPRENPCLRRRAASTRARPRACP